MWHSFTSITNASQPPRLTYPLDCNPFATPLLSGPLASISGSLSRIVHRDAMPAQAETFSCPHRLQPVTGHNAKRKRLLSFTNHYQPPITTVIATPEMRSVYTQMALEGGS